MQNFYPVLNVNRRLSITEFSDFDNNEASELQRAANLIFLSSSSMFKHIEFLPLFSMISFRLRHINKNVIFNLNILRENQITEFIHDLEKFMHECLVIRIKLHQHSKEIYRWKKNYFTKREEN